MNFCPQPKKTHMKYATVRSINIKNNLHSILKNSKTRKRQKKGEEKEGKDKEKVNNINIPTKKKKMQEKNIFFKNDREKRHDFPI